MDLIQKQFNEFLVVYTKMIETHELSGSDIDVAMKGIHEQYEKLIAACKESIEKHKKLEELNEEFNRRNDIFLEKAEEFKRLNQIYVGQAGQATLFDDPEVPGRKLSYTEMKILYDK